MTETKIANPGPLGLSAFALTTFVLSVINAGILKGGGDDRVVIGLALFYGGIAQLVAGIWEFRTGNTFGATAFCSYGAFWLSFAAILLGLGVTPGNAPSLSALGYYALAWAIFTFIMMLGSFRTNGATAAVFVLLFVTFLLLAIGFLGQKTGSYANIYKIGGFVGIATAIVAWYTALAGIIAGVSNGKMSLPTFPLS